MYEYFIFCFDAWFPYFYETFDCCVPAIAKRIACDKNRPNERKIRVCSSIFKPTLIYSPNCRLVTLIKPVIVLADATAATFFHNPFFMPLNRLRLQFYNMMRINSTVTIFSTQIMFLLCFYAKIRPYEFLSLRFKAFFLKLKKDT